MLVPDQMVEVRIGVKTLKHYQALGYNAKCFDTIIVPPEHLTKGSNVSVQVQCDVCQKVISRAYEHYLEMHIDGCDTCNECKSIKSKRTCLEKYGVENPMQLQENKDKAKQTNIKKYGVKHAMKLKKTQELAQETNLQKYGVKHPAQNSDIQEKQKKTLIAKYGVESIFQADEIKDKIKKTLRDKYGVDNISQIEEVKKKKKESTMKHYGVENPFQNGFIPTSSQQIQLYEIIKEKYPNAELNYPFSTCSLDIFVCVNNIKLDVEYDGSYWHQDKQKDIKRDKFLQSRGFKTLRIRSGRLIPAEQELFDAIDYLVNTEHHFKEIILPDWKECDE